MRYALVVAEIVADVLLFRAVGEINRDFKELTYIVYDFFLVEVNLFDSFAVGNKEVKSAKKARPTEETVGRAFLSDAALPVTCGGASRRCQVRRP